jgi:hypothetical protein
MTPSQELEACECHTHRVFLFNGSRSETFRRLYGFKHAVFFQSNKCLGVEFYQLLGIPYSQTFL